MKVGVEYSIDKVVWEVEWFDEKDIETLVDSISCFTTNIKCAYGSVWVKTKFIYEEES